MGSIGLGLSWRTVWTFVVGWVVLRLFILPGGRRRRVMWVHYFANRGNVPKSVFPRRLEEAKVVMETPVRVIRIMGGNPGRFTLQGSCTYLVGGGSNRILIDTGEGKQSYYEMLKKILEDEDCKISHVLITHRHTDHMGGIFQVLRLCPKARIFKFLLSPGETDLEGNHYENLCHNDVFSVEAALDSLDASNSLTDKFELRALETPGHTRDHICFALEKHTKSAQGQSKVIGIFTGDCVLGSGTSVFSNLHEYMNTLQRLKDLIMTTNYKPTRTTNEHVPKISELEQVILFPGHGEIVIDGEAKLEEYISRRFEREAEILKLLQFQPSNVSDLVEKIYGDQHLSFAVKFGAKRAIKQHLDKLEKEDKIVRHRRGFAVKQS